MQTFNQWLELRENNAYVSDEDAKAIIVQQTNLDPSQVIVKLDYSGLRPIVPSEISVEDATRMVAQAKGISNPVFRVFVKVTSQFSLTPAHRAMIEDEKRKAIERQRAGIKATNEKGQSRDMIARKLKVGQRTLQKLMNGETITR